MIFPIVTGHGEVRSIRILLERVAAHIDPGLHVIVHNAYRMNESALAQTDAASLGKALQLGAARVRHAGAVLILLDSEDHCPGELGPRLYAACNKLRPDLFISVVCAHREFETWFLWAIESLRGVSGIPADISMPNDPEAIRGAKEWLARVRNSSYSPTTDQPRFTAQFDLTLARRSGSFGKLLREMTRIVTHLRRGVP